MEMAKREKLEQARFGALVRRRKFLGLSVDAGPSWKLELGSQRRSRVRGENQGLTQVALAERLGSSQSRVAKEAIPRVSVDLLNRDCSRPVLLGVKLQVPSTGNPSA
jgi:hypothetical protein